MAQPGFWDDQEAARVVVTELSAGKTVIEPVEEVVLAVHDLAELFELALEEDDGQVIASIEQDLAGLAKRCDTIEVTGMLSGPDDTKACFFSIHAGAGGTESCDWANMLLRMYTRYFDDNKFKYEELDITPGEEVGVRSVTLKVSGAFVSIRHKQHPQNLIHPSNPNSVFRCQDFRMCFRVHRYFGLFHTFTFPARVRETLAYVLFHVKRLHNVLRLRRDQAIGPKTSTSLFLNQPQL